MFSSSKDAGAGVRGTAPTIAHPGLCGYGQNRRLDVLAISCALALMTMTVWDEIKGVLLALEASGAPVSHPDPRSDVGQEPSFAISLNPWATGAAEDLHRRFGDGHSYPYGYGADRQGATSPRTFNSVTLSRNKSSGAPSSPTTQM